MVADSQEAIAAESGLTHPCYVVNSEQLDDLVQKHAEGKWFRHHGRPCGSLEPLLGWIHLAHGGAIIDTDSASSAFPLPAKASKTIRTSIEVLAKRRLGLCEKFSNSGSESIWF